MRPEEQYAGVYFLKYLASQNIPATYTPGEDPPDICFNVNGTLWAAEVTRLVQYIDNEGKEESRKGTEKRLEKIINTIDKKTVSVRKSGYHIGLMRNLTKKQEVDLSREIIKLISSNQSAPDRLSEIEKYCYVRQVNDPERKIVKSVGCAGVDKIPGCDKTVGDIQATIGYSVDRILNAKGPILDKLNGYNKKILLILSYGYMFADRVNVGRAIEKKYKDIKGIDEIYLVDINSQVSLVYPHVNLSIDGAVPS